MYNLIFLQSFFLSKNLSPFLGAWIPNFVFLLLAFYFLKNAKKYGGMTKNGKMMFIYQAQKAFFIWHKVVPEVDDETINLLDL